jgi:hypothetical protein
MPELSEERANQLVNTFSTISIVVYVGVAILLSIIAILSLIESFLEVLVILTTMHWEEGIIQVIIRSFLLSLS